MTVQDLSRLDWDCLASYPEKTSKPKKEKRQFYHSKPKNILSKKYSNAEKQRFLKMSGNVSTQEYTLLDE